MLASLLFGRSLLDPRWRYVGWAVGGLCLLAVMVVLSRWRRATRTCELALSTLLPELVPAERMTEDARSTAAAARAMLESLNLGRASAPARAPQPQPEASWLQAAGGAGGLPCGQCGRLNEPHHRFCLGCGAQLVPQSSAPSPQAAPGTDGVPCPLCGRLNQPHHRFCLGCGAQL